MGTLPGPPPPHAPPSETLWYYELNGETKGPVPEGKIKVLLMAREINENTLLWSEDLGDWTPLGKVPTFRAPRQ